MIIARKDLQQIKIKNFYCTHKTIYYFCFRNLTYNNMVLPQKNILADKSMDICSYSTQLRHNNCKLIASVEKSTKKMNISKDSISYLSSTTYSYFTLFVSLCGLKKIGYAAQQYGLQQGNAFNN